MYSIYHIKGVKWGMTKNLNQRLKQQGYALSDVAAVIKEEDLDKAADLERELNLRDGYGWNSSQDYRKVLDFMNHNNRHKHNFTKEESTLGGYITGKKKTPKQQKARKENIKIATEAAQKANKKPIIQMDLDGNFIKEWDSTAECCKQLNLHGSNVSRVLNGLQPYHKGYTFKYKNPIN